MKIRFLWVLLFIWQLSAGDYEERFDTIYREKLWGVNEEGEGFSGGGSLLENIRPFVEYLTWFLKEHQIKSVVDLGCGDWTLFRHIDWTGIDYVGYDVVKSVIDKNIQKYGSDHIRFVHANFLEAEVPSADLMICKHVLQHIPNRDVFIFIDLLPRFKHSLILNSSPVDRVNIDHPVMDIFPFWEDRGLDLTLPPFNVKGENVLIFRQQYAVSGSDLVTHVEGSPESIRSYDRD